MNLNDIFCKNPFDNPTITVLTTYQIYTPAPLLLLPAYFNPIIIATTRLTHLQAKPVYEKKNDSVNT